MGDLCRGEKRGRQEGGKVEGGNSSGVGEDAMPHRLRHFSRPGVERRFSASRFIDASRLANHHRRSRLYIRARPTLRTYRSFNRPMTRTRTRTGFTEAAYILAGVRCTL